MSIMVHRNKSLLDWRGQRQSRVFYLTLFYLLFEKDRIAAANLREDRNRKKYPEGGSTASLRLPAAVNSNEEEAAATAAAGAGDEEE